MTGILKWPGMGAVLLLRFYRRFLSPVKPPCCRFVPTCSEYAIEAVSRFGFVRGAWLAAGRLTRCHPFHRGAVYDPVPGSHGGTTAGS